VADALTTALLAQGFVLIETHISRVYLRGEHVYKTKRAVNFGFLDFGTLAARKAACDAEVELNRRLARDVYLGVVAIVGEPGAALRFVPASDVDPQEVLEWAVHMKRLDEGQRADALLTQGQLARADLEAVARLLADFHRAARADAHTAAFGEAAVIQGNVDENFAQVEATIADHLSESERAELEDFQRRFLTTHAALFARRVREGRVRDGHGDLRLEHVYREQDGYVVLDCIEFNERFRFADVCADLAFLAMDLRYHDRVELAEYFVSSYACASGDYELYALLDFYESYRAMVRAKVTSFLAEDGEVQAATRERARHEARRYYLLALSAARRSVRPSRMVIVAGLVASGKSTLAEALAAELAVPLLSADCTRKELLGMASREPGHDPGCWRAYSHAMSERLEAT
jgi:aminoglycoside phosphotransferase family enzyme